MDLDLDLVLRPGYIDPNLTHCHPVHLKSQGSKKAGNESRAEVLRFLEPSKSICH